MSLFACSKCKTIDNTATSGYWFRGEGQPPLCSACDPAIGKWHGCFRRTKFNRIFWTSEDGRYVSRRWFAPTVLVWHIKVKSRGALYKIIKLYGKGTDIIRRLVERTRN